MDWKTALEILVARTRHERYRVLTAGEHPDHESWRRTVVALAADPGTTAPAPTSPPPLLARAASLVRAVVTHVAAGMPTLGDDAYDARLAVCGPCDERLPSGVCAGCGCVLALKARWRHESCPKGKWPDPED